MQKSRPGTSNYVGNKQQMLLDIKESLKHLQVNEAGRGQQTPANNALSTLVDNNPPVPLPITSSAVGQPGLGRRQGGGQRFVAHQKKLDEISKSLAPHKEAAAQQQELTNGILDANNIGYPNEAALHVSWFVWGLF